MIQVKNSARSISRDTDFSQTFQERGNLLQHPGKVLFNPKADLNAQKIEMFTQQGIKKQNRRGTQTSPNASRSGITL